MPCLADSTTRCAAQPGGYAGEVDHADLLQRFYNYANTAETTAKVPDSDNAHVGSLCLSLASFLRLTLPSSCACLSAHSCSPATIWRAARWASPACRRCVASRSPRASLSPRGTSRPPLRQPPRTKWCDSALRVIPEHSFVCFLSLLAFGQGHNFGMQHDDKTGILGSITYDFVIQHCYTSQINYHIMANQSLEGIVPDRW